MEINLYDPKFYISIGKIAFSSYFGLVYIFKGIKFMYGKWENRPYLEFIYIDGNYEFFDGQPTFKIKAEIINHGPGIRVGGFTFKINGVTHGEECLGISYIEEKDDKTNSYVIYSYPAFIYNDPDNRDPETNNPKEVAFYDAENFLFKTNGKIEVKIFYSREWENLLKGNSVKAFLKAQLYYKSKIDKWLSDNIASFYIHRTDIKHWEWISEEECKKYKEAKDVPVLIKHLMNKQKELELLKEKLTQ